MKKKLIILIIFPTLILAQQSQKKIVASQFMVYGNCEMCKKTIEKAALSIKGVKMAKWDIPSNQLEKWLKLEAERFRYPVFRLFHTELEAVYERVLR